MRYIYSNLKELDELYMHDTLITSFDDLSESDIKQLLLALLDWIQVNHGKDVGTYFASKCEDIWTIYGDVVEFDDKELYQILFDMLMLMDIRIAHNTTIDEIEFGIFKMKVRENRIR